MGERTKEQRKVLLVGWDAADWEHINPLLEQGLMPTLDGLINRGVMGNLATLQPILSPMLWNSIATGKFPDKHGIHGFIEPDPINGGARPYASTSRKCKAIWNILSQSGLRSNIVGWWASHPAEPIKGTVVTNAFGGVKFSPEKGWSIPPGTVHPEEKATSLARFKVFPTELTEAHVLPFIPEAAKINQKKDKKLDSFIKVLSDNATIQAVATTLMETEPWDFTAVYFDGIDHFSHAFMAYHPPKLPWIDQEEFDLYKDVVKGAYRFHDMMLERLIQLAGPETTVILCSDHGFESGSQRPRGIPREPAGPAVWHRQYGIFVVAGPGIKKDERIYGASLIDITPTILTLLDVPIGEDMDGRPLLEAFEVPPAVKTVRSWDKIDGDSGLHPEGKQMDRQQAQELMQQFAALGYIEDPGADKKKQQESAEIESKYNIARTYLWKNRPDQALPLLAEITARHPWEDRFIMQLTGAYFQAGYLAQAERLLVAAYDFDKTTNVGALLLMGRVKLALGEPEAGLEKLLAAGKVNPEIPSVHIQLGDTYLRLHRWSEAKEEFEKVIALDSDNALGYQGLSTIYRRLGQNQEAADTALQAVGLLHRLPLAHFNLGVAMARSGETERAIVAFETALRFNPDFLNAHRYLALLHKANGGDVKKVQHHRREAVRLGRTRRPRSARTDEKRDKLFDLPKIPPQEERIATLLKERPDQKPPREDSGKTFVLVSGLPRSGTSLMMQLLAAGGLPPMTDNEREADIDNPRGYFEWESIKRIAKEPELLDDPAVEGKAIKCISMLLPKMPEFHRYKVIFMTRPIEEVIESQQKMTTRLGTKGGELDREQMERGMAAHRDETRKRLATSTNIETLEVDYPTLITDPAAVIDQLVEFLGPERLPTPEKMAATVDPSLYRRRKAS
ncbi:MAG TPA: alkaline phosphatase family protein [Chthoniobacterales bacterium]